MLTEGIIAAISAAIGALGVLIVNVIKANKSKNEVRGQEYEHTENLVKLMSGTVQEIGNLRNEMNSKFEELNDKIDDFKDEQKRVNIAALRHDIIQTYETYKDEKKIPTHVYESTDYLYDRYKECGGNSFIDEVMNEMRRWELT